MEVGWKGRMWTSDVKVGCGSRVERSDVEVACKGRMERSDVEVACKGRMWKSDVVWECVGVFTFRLFLVPRRPTKVVFRQLWNRCVSVQTRMWYNEELATYQRFAIISVGFFSCALSYGKFFGCRKCRQCQANARAVEATDDMNQSYSSKSTGTTSQNLSFVV